MGEAKRELHRIQALGWTAMLPATFTGDDVNPIVAATIADLLQRYPAADDVDLSDYAHLEVDRLCSDDGCHDVDDIPTASGIDMADDVLRKAFELEALAAGVGALTGHACFADTAKLLHNSAGGLRRLASALRGLDHKVTFVDVAELDAAERAFEG